MVSRLYGSRVLHWIMTSRNGVRAEGGVSNFSRRSYLNNFAAFVPKRIDAPEYVFSSFIYLSPYLLCNRYAFTTTQAR